MFLIYDYGRICPGLFFLNNAKVIFTQPPHDLGGGGIGAGQMSCFLYMIMVEFVPSQSFSLSHPMHRNLLVTWHKDTCHPRNLLVTWHKDTCQPRPIAVLQYVA
jgi:hypothetical protein